MPRSALLIIMDQYYLLGKARGDGTRRLLYRYGNYCYYDDARSLPRCEILEQLPAMVQHVQSIQGTIPYLCEYKDLVPGTLQHSTLHRFAELVQFAYNELIGSEVRAAGTRRGARLRRPPPPSHLHRAAPHARAPLRAPAPPVD